MLTKVYGVLNQLDEKLNLNVLLNQATGDEAALKLSYTTNKATLGNDYGFEINFTNTSSPGNSRPFRVVVDGAEMFAIKETGDLTFIAGAKLVDSLNPAKYFQLSNGEGFSILRQYFGYKFVGYDGGVYSNQLTTAALLNQSSGAYNSFYFSPTVRQSGTAGYSAIVLNVTEASLGSGTNYLMKLQVGGSNKFGIRNDVAYAASSPTATGTVPIEIGGVVYNFLVST